MSVNSRSARVRSRPKPKPKRTRLSVGARKEQLLALGLRAFGKRPYDQVSVDAIADEAGISRGLLFHYYPSKHAFYLAVVEAQAAELLASSLEAPGEDVLARFVAGLRAYFAFVEKNAASYATLLRAGVGTDKAVLKLVEKTRARFVAQMKSELPARVVPDTPLTRARLRGWIGLVEAVALDWIDHRDTEPDALVEMLIHAFPGIVGVSPDELLAGRSA